MKRAIDYANDIPRAEFETLARFKDAIRAALRAEGVPHSDAQYDLNGICLTCHKGVICPGVHTLEEIQEAGRREAAKAAALPAFRVTYEDGSSYVTSMAKGVTLAEARAYFEGTVHEMSDEKTHKAVKSVEEA